VSLLWGIFLHFQVEKVIYGNVKGIEALIRWSQECTLPYNLIINDFSLSFQDGMVFCGILHHYKNLAELEPSNLSPVIVCYGIKK
jgi:hypothetical protein